MDRTGRVQEFRKIAGRVGSNPKIWTRGKTTEFYFVQSTFESIQARCIDSILAQTILSICL